MSNSQLDHDLGYVRELTSRYKAGGPDAFDAFRNLVQFLLGQTVIADRAFVRLASGPRDPQDRLALGGANGPQDPLLLRDGRHLKVSMLLFRSPHDGGFRLKNDNTLYQYQHDRDGDSWIFRYEYARQRDDDHPLAHFHVNAELRFPIDGEHKSLDRIHFPTDRVSVEAVIRLLISEFVVAPKTTPDYWQPLLEESEAAFKQIAHRP